MNRGQNGVVEVGKSTSMQGAHAYQLGNAKIVVTKPSDIGQSWIRTTTFQPRFTSG